MIDCSIAYDEVELLELRLHTLREVVDVFVVAECKFTHAGHEKPLYISEAKLAGRFQGFDLRVHVLDRQPPESPDGFPYGGRWPREYALRNSLADAIRYDAAPGDFVLLSDCDEIPDPSLVRDRHVGVHVQRLFVYYLNALFPSEWLGTVSCPYEALFYQTPHALRASNGQMPRAPGGWHFSYQGGVERICQKTLRDATDAEAVGPQHFAEMAMRRERLEDPRGRIPPAGLSPGKIIPVDETFPPYIIEHPERFPGWIKECA